MIFALAVQSNVLYAFADEEACMAHCAAVEVADQQWLFFDDDGGGMRPQFIERAQYAHGMSRTSSYFLRPWASCSSCALPQVLPFVREVRGAAPFDSIASIERYIARSTSGRG